MKAAIAIPFRARAPKGFGYRLRALLPGATIVASHSADATQVRGADVNIFHPNTTATGIERNIFYGNSIMFPLLSEAQKHGDVVLYMHDDVLPTKQQAETLVRYIERVPALRFASAAPRSIPMPSGDRAISDWPDALVAWRSSSIPELIAQPFTAEEGKNLESTMLILMNRMKAAGISEQTGWIWVKDMLVEPETKPAPPAPIAIDLKF